MLQRMQMVFKCKPSSVRSTNTNAEDKNCERYNQSTRSKPMVQIPAMLLRFPVAGQGCWRPLSDSVVDGHRSDERKHDSENLASESDCSEVPRRFIQILEG